VELGIGSGRLPPVQECRQQSTATAPAFRAGRGSRVTRGGWFRCPLAAPRASAPRAARRPQFILCGW